MTSPYWSSSRIPRKDFFRIMKSTDSEKHLDIFRDDLNNFENVQLNYSYENNKTSINCRGIILWKNKSNHILHGSALKTIYILLSSAIMSHILIYLILIPNLRDGYFLILQVRQLKRGEFGELAKVTQLVNSKGGF